ncbi:MAG: hypothetical protein HN348_32020, partial [Proteobacteria bacterium]|nr:hypothetical protein [Pseudomonadota bacterium]
MFSSVLLTLALNAPIGLAAPDILAEHKTGVRAPEDVAVVVGIEDYPFLPDVPYAKRDAEAFYRYLIYTRGIPPDRVKLLINAPTADEVRKAVQVAASRVVENGTVWVYFAGHGAASVTSRKRMLLGVDTKADADSMESRSIHLDQVQATVTASKAGKAILVVDACYAGVGRDGQELMGGKRFAVPAYAAADNAQITVWSASSANELSGPFEPARHGLFTYFAVGALRGWADGEFDDRRDGQVTLAEAQTYVAKAIRTVSEGGQQPTMETRPIPKGWVLTTANNLEEGPDLAALLLDQTGPGPDKKVVGPAEAPPGADPYLAELERLRQAQAARKAQQQADRDAQQRKLAQATERIRSEAHQAWTITSQIADAGGPEGELALLKFAERYANASVTIDGAKYLVQIPELAMAERRAENYGA